MTSIAAVDRVIEGLLRPLDGVRRVVLRASGRSLRSALRNRGLRVALLSFLVICVAAVATIIAPRQLFLYGPILFGVPHLLADFRYLVFRKSLVRERWFHLAVVPALLATTLAGDLRYGCLAVATVGICAGGSEWKRAVIFFGALMLFATVTAFPRESARWFMHLHNFVAIACFVALTHERKHALRSLPALFLFALASAFFLSGGTTQVPGAEGILQRAFADPGFGSVVERLFPSFTPATTVNLMLFFLFAQSVHYGIWVRLVPEEARKREGVRSFASSYRALVKDMGSSWPLVAVGLLGVLVCWSLVDAWGAWDGYLTLAYFHGPLEICALSWLFVRGESLHVSPSPVDPAPELRRERL